MPLITTLANAGARGYGFSGVGAPSAPTIGVAAASSTTSATVNYTAPSSNGGSPITSYTAVAVPGGQTGTVVRSGSGSITVSGLTSGVSYQFYVYATNGVGDGPNSALSNSMTTAAVPGTPTIGMAYATGATAASVDYTAPTSDGGSAITSYTAVASPGGQTATVYQSGSGSISISGLSANTTYQFRVYATNAYGSGSYSGYSNSVTTTAAVPGAPTIGTASATGATTATVSYTAPASNGGSAITSYTAVAMPGGQTATVYQSGSGSISISGLSSGTTYQFRVYASNAYGNGPYSGYSNSVTTQALFTFNVYPTTRSIDIPRLSTPVVTNSSFTVSASSGSGSITIEETLDPIGGSISISPSSFTLSAGASKTITVSCTSPAGEWQTSAFTYGFAVKSSISRVDVVITQNRV